MFKLIWRLVGLVFLAAAAFIALAVFSQTETRFMQHATIQPQACFSVDDFERGNCFGYMRATLNFYHKREANPPGSNCYEDEFARGECAGYSSAVSEFTENHFPEFDVACFLGEVLALRNVALHGWEQIRETLAWAETREGRAQIQGEGAKRALETSQEFAQNALLARETISARQAGARLPAFCSIAMRIQSLWR